jgi:hypothetical protein
LSPLFALLRCGQNPDAAALDAQPAFGIKLDSLGIDFAFGGLDAIGERVGGVVFENGHGLLHDDRPVVVLGVDEMDGGPADLGAGFDHGLVYVVAVHAAPAERRDQRRVNVHDLSVVSGVDIEQAHEARQRDEPGVVRPHFAPHGLAERRRVGKILARDRDGGDAVVSGALEAVGAVARADRASSSPDSMRVKMFSSVVPPPESNTANLSAIAVSPIPRAVYEFREGIPSRMVWGTRAIAVRGVRCYHDGMESNGEPLLYRRHVAAGLAFWGVFCVVAVVLRGVRWDEQYEFAQVITGAVVYPEGHPYPYCAQNALNLQIYGTAALHWLTGSARIVCGFRNVLYLLATVAPLYLLGALLAGGHPRVGLFMLGLMPCVHIGQMPILLGCCAVAGAIAAWKSPAVLKRLLRAAPWGLAGLAVCAAVWLGKGAMRVALPESGPYASAAAPAAVWAGYIAQDALRALPGRPTSYTNSFIALAGALLIATLLCFPSRKNPQSAIHNPQSIVWLYVLLAAGAVWGVMGAHYALGERVPYVLISWMPYRFANHAAYILIAATAAVLCGNSMRTQWFMPAVLALGAMRPFLEGLVPENVYTRYVAGGEGLLFFLVGAACFVLSAQSRENKRLFRVATIAMGSSAVALGALHQFGLACAAAGFVAAAAAMRLRAAATPRAAAVLLAVALAGATAAQWRGRQDLPASPFDRDVASCLAARGEGGAMLLARPEQYTLQAKTGHPVVADTCLAPWIPYMPAIGPAIEKIHRDFYGETFSPPHKGQWNQLWRGRTETDWRDLRRAYRVRYVVSPNQVPLQLPVAVRGEMETLYAIP